VENHADVMDRLLDTKRVIDMERASADFPRDPRPVRLEKPREFPKIPGRFAAADRDADGMFTIDDADAHPSARQFHACIKPGNAPAYDNRVKGLHWPSPFVRLIAETGQNAKQLPQSTHRPVMALELSRTWIAMTGHTEEHPAQNVQSDWSMIIASAKGDRIRAGFFSAFIHHYLHKCMVTAVAFGLIG